MSKNLLDVDEIREKLKLLMNKAPFTWKQVSEKSKVSMASIARILADKYDNFNQVTLRKLHNFITRYTPKWKD